MAAAIALAERNGDFGHSSFAVSVKELGSMENHAVVFLTCSGEESGHVNQSNQRNIESVAEAYKAGAFARSVAVEHAGKEFGLVSHDAHGLAVEAGEAHDDILGIIALHFQEFAVVHDGADNLVHVVGTVGRVGDDFVERVLETVDGVGAFNQRGFLKVVLGNVAEELADDFEGFLTIFGCEVGHAALGGVNFGAAEGILGHIFAGNGLHYLRAGKEHIGDSFGHDGEVGEGGRINGTAGAGTENSRNLGNYTGSEDIALENLGIAGQCVDAFLDTGATRVVKTDYGSSHLHGHIHDFADFQCHGLAE